VETLAERYGRLKQEMDALSKGSVLASATEAVLAELPAGPLTLLSSSDQGAGLAAACASRRDAETAWRKINLVGPQPASTVGQIIVIEPVDPGVGWRRAVERSYPGARLLFLSALKLNAVAVAA
jgi:hypothetical protein